MEESQIAITDTEPKEGLPRIAAFLVALVIVSTAFAAVSVWMDWESNISSLKTLTWKKAPCTIISNSITKPEGVDTEGTRHSVDFEYTYSVDGVDYVSRNYSPGDSIPPAEIHRFPSGKKTFCRYDPEDPYRAVLSRFSFEKNLGVFLHPLTYFVALLMAAMLGAGLGRRETPVKKIEDVIIKDSAANNDLALGMITLQSVAITLVALLVVGFAAMKRLSICDWVTTPCTVISSEVGQPSKGEFRPDIVFEYTFDNKRYTSNRYFAKDLRSNYYDESAVIVRHFAPGMQTTCYVDPKTPSNASLSKRMRRSPFSGVVALFFFLGGFGSLMVVAHAREYGLSPGVLHQRLGPLPKSSSNKKKWFFWPLVVFLGVLIWTYVGELPESASDLCYPDVLFIGALVFGLLCIMRVPAFLLDLSNPKSELTARNSPSVGNPMELKWRLSGNTDRVRSVRFTIESIQMTASDGGAYGRNTIYRQVLHETSDPAKIAYGGDITFAIPDTCEPTSFDKKVVWRIIVLGKTRPWLWPNILEEFEIVVSP